MSTKYCFYIADKSSSVISVFGKKRGRVPTLHIQADSLSNLIQAVGGPALVASLLLSASAAYQEGTIGQDTEIFNIQ